MSDATPSEPPELPEAVAKVAEYAQELVDAVDGALDSWVLSQVARLAGPDPGDSEPGDSDRLAELTQRCRATVMAPLRAVLVLDIDAQRSTPLTEIGRAVAPITEYLHTVRIAPVARDPYDTARDPDDLYGLMPRTWSDLGATVAEAGMTWGAAKAYLHLARRRR